MAGLRARPQPATVEAPLGVREYWYDTFYRVVVVPVPGGCVLLSADVYSKRGPEGPSTEAIGFGEPPVSLHYHRLSPEELGLSVGWGRIEWVELVTLDYGSGRELVNARLLVCGVNGYPSYEDVEAVYRQLRRALGAAEPRAKG